MTDAQQSAPQSGAMSYQPPLSMRIWQALGFRYSAYAGRPEDDDAVYACHIIVMHWSWGDRLRLLISGKAEVELCVETEAAEKLKGTRSRAVVLAPNAR